MLDQSGQHALKVMNMINGSAAAQSEIVASWRRCVSVHKLSPEQDVHTEILTEFELREAVGPLEPYIRMAKPDLLSLARQVARAGFFVSFSDANGTALLHLGALPSTAPITHKICDGMMWREDFQGTNAIGTGLLLSRPMAIHMGEHFFASNGPLTCLVTPLYDPYGKILGAINIATASSTYEPRLSSVLLGTLVTTSQHIESRLFRAAYGNAMIVSLPEAAGVHGSAPLIAVDRDLKVVGATHAARSSYGLSSEALEQGLSISRFFPEIAVDETSLAQAEQVTIERALSDADHCVSLAATRLGISRATMHRKMRAHSILRKQHRKGRQRTTAARND